MKPDITQHNPNPEYLRSLIKQVGLHQHEAAKVIGVSERMMRYYLSLDPAAHRPAPYLVQFALECMAQGKEAP